VEILGEEFVTSREFCQLLETGMAEAKVALIPPSMDQVLVGDMERTRLKDIRALFFVGVNEGNIPKSAQSGGILSELDRDFLSNQGLELAPGPKEQMNIQRFYLYLNLCKPREVLCLSFSQSNSKGEAVTPAYLINQIRTLFPKLEIDSAGSGQEPAELLETPGTAMEYFLNGLLEEHAGEREPVFRELYSWYLKSPEYGTVIRRLVDAAFTRKPVDVISKSVAKVLYGEVSPYSATRLERFSACAFAHFLQYGLRVTERAEYEFKAMDMGNLMHQALEDFAVEVQKKGLQWNALDDETREELADTCLDRAAADYGNTILKSSARNEAMLERTRRLLHRTVWALQEQLKNGQFTPEGFEVSFGGGRIDRLDILEEEDKVYIKVIDYKTGNTAFDLVALYHGLQLQLMIYLDAALEIEEKRFPGKRIEPAGIFYYNVKDPMLQEQMEADLADLDGRILKELKMNGLVQADREVAEKLDASMVSLPAAINKDGSFRKGSSAATREQFAILNQYVKRKISDIQTAILDGEAAVSPYELKKKDACTYCPYASVCGYDRKIPGFEHRRLKNFNDEELWQAFLEGGETHGSDMDG
ncbi:MAG: PD-(D/E)XK nuclease family protein, partial [Blautia sp.]|nr:PD-(D/E)XK nuclease family protein [Blautia sp.]